MRNVQPYLPRPVPPSLEGLAELALDLRWSWNHAADALWRSVDSRLWTATSNPWLILQSVSQTRLEALARDGDFVEALQRQVAERRESLSRPSWFARREGTVFRSAAYLSMEFGLSEALPVYSGGLGVLAGDLLKAASDLGVPVIGVGLLYQRGYFRQVLDAAGRQLEFYPYSDPVMLPVVPARDGAGEWVHVGIELPGRSLTLRAWEARAGRVRLLLLDSNDPLNSPADRGITSDLYGGGPELRLQQEMVLGIGSWRLLRALGLECEVCHLNEGHAALAVLERARDYMQQTGQPFGVALRCTRAGNLFTTHTPVEAGFDRFPPGLVRQYLAGLAVELGVGVDEILALGRAAPGDAGEPFNMTYLAVRGSAAVNGVSRLHGEVSRRIFQPLFPRWPQEEVPVGYVTNGVHFSTWDSVVADDLWTELCGKERWRGGVASLERCLRAASDERLWQARCRSRELLIEAVRDRLGRQARARGEAASAPARCLRTDALTLGFARRFAAYKRPCLLLLDERRLVRLLAEPARPLQLVIAGKAHPRDDEGKRLVGAWVDFIRRWRLHERCVFLEDYDMDLAAQLVQGVDVWINTPRRPWEACGTSGMKVLVNTGLNVSTLDGWWAEAYSPEVGWAIGDATAQTDEEGQDRADAEVLYNMLEREVIPNFFERGADGMPHLWINRMRESMARLTPVFSANRMMREYTERYYLPMADAYHRRRDQAEALAVSLEDWQRTLVRSWEGIRFGRLEVRSTEREHRFRVELRLGDIPPDAVRVEIYAEPRPGETGHTAILTAGAAESEARWYEGSVPATRPAGDYTPRVVPAHREARIPLEAPQIRWQR